MADPIRSRLADIAARLGPRLGLDRDWYLMVLAGLIGLLMSGVAMAFMLPLHWIESHAAAVSRDDPSVLWWLVPLAPVVGALGCGIVYLLLPSGPGSIPGPGVTRVLYAVHRNRARLPARSVARKWIASLLTIGSGGSAGAEGPIVTIGAGIASVAGTALGLNAQRTATLLGCGAAAGIASVFTAPIAGVFFVMEIILRDFSLRTFTPIVIASVISSAATQAVLGNDAIFAHSGAITIEAFNWVEIPNYLLLGATCGVAAALFIRSLYWSMDMFARLRVPDVTRPAVGAVALGVLGLGWLALVQPPEAPAFYGNGYPVIRELLEPSYYLDHSLGAGLLAVMIALALLKGVATCLTIGSGGAGGLFAPSLLLGACVGGAFGIVVNHLAWFPSVSPAHYALVGMAAMVAATTHAPLTAILIVYEITQRYEIILPLMLAAVISTLVGRLVYRESAYTVRLSEAGVRVGAMSDLTVLRRLVASDVPLLAPVFVAPTDSAQRLLNLSERMSIGDFVVARRNKYLGMVTGADLKEALVYREAIPLLQVDELARSDLPTVAPDETLDLVLDKFATYEVNSLAVVEPGTDAVVGLITRSRLMQRYQAALHE